MKLTNHPKNNSYDINTYVMRGTITMNKKEWEKALKFLQKEYKKAIKNCNTYTRDNLHRFEDRIIRPNLFCLGVTATQLLINKYNLQNYKDVSYGIRIKK